ncbi:hypothetical protein FZEAL_1541 [Fusarium zealandicum]|uniref:Monopolin complex subunit Csm1/Pcs1 C-terminal domain-containing protein n=1 Tax=Fusarium zealandicum TaxID=1053134 RepID=A0A8H4USG7_9HYPO|nr:hypothetical protein FZEAL_1541 [Fusarium zealandicum]
MPPRARAKPASALAGLVASDSEPDFDAFDESEIQAARTMSVVKKPRGRPPGTASKVTKTAPRTTRRTSGKLPAVPESAARPTAAAKANSGATRGVRKAQEPDETVTFEDIEPTAAITSTVTKKGTRGRPRGVSASATKKASNDTSVLVPASTAKRRGRPPRQAVQPLEEIPETQQDASLMDLDDSMETNEVHEDAPMATEPAEAWTGYDVGDAALRRRLGDLTKKYESLEMRHRDLRDVGVKEAERNFERLKKQAEDRTAAANKLIAELKAELAAQTVQAKEAEHLQRQLEANEARAENLASTIEDLNATLSEAELKNKTLSTKLAAIRSGDANSRIPGSVMKANGGANRTAQPEAAHAALATAQAKEDLYADLTGLIVRGVKQEEEEEVFDCIQTGRNGTLHFELAIEKGEASDSYEDVEITYRSLLDDNRDAELKAMLPFYLKEDIQFPRSEATRFYTRVVKSIEGTSNE